MGSEHSEQQQKTTTTPSTSCPTPTTSQDRVTRVRISSGNRVLIYQQDESTSTDTFVDEVDTFLKRSSPDITKFFDTVLDDVDEQYTILHYDDAANGHESEDEEDDELLTPLLRVNRRPKP